jgi:methionyl-tRNA synthetase
MADKPRFYITTAIDYPNSRPHIGTAFEKIGADVQARYRRMEGYEVFFLMGNDENTVKVSKKAAEFRRDPKEYCDDMARQFIEVWRALEISFDDFIQTSDPCHHAGCQKFIQKVYDNGHIYKGGYEGWYCEGCEEFKTEQQIKDAGGVCPNHKTPPIRRVEEAYFFRLSAFQDQLLRYYEENPQFIQPESRRNEIVSLIKNEGLLDINITRAGEDWGIRVPFDPKFTIYVWFDALLNYITGIGYGEDEERFKKWWPADIHFIGKDITRFHCALWPAMCFAAGIEPPSHVFGHGFVYFDGKKMSKAIGNVVEPMDLITKFNAEAFRYYFLRKCPFPGDGDFTWDEFARTYDGDLAKNLGNLYSRVVSLIGKNCGGQLEGTAGVEPAQLGDGNLHTTVQQIQAHIESCRYNQALELIWLQVLTPANQYADRTEPWQLVKNNLPAARRVLFDLVERLRAASILLKPFLPTTAEKIYRSFNFPQPWEEVCCEAVYRRPQQPDDLRVLAKLVGGKPEPLLPRIG